MVIEYDPSIGIVVSAFFTMFGKTIIPMVVCDKEFWLFLILNLAVFMFKHTGLFTPEPLALNLPFGLTGVTGGLMTFFVVFYNGHVFSRYNELYDITREMFEVVIKIATLLRVNIPDERARWKVAKLTLASPFIFVFERTEHDKDEEPEAHTFEDGTSTAEWDQLAQLGILTKDEITALHQHCRHFGENATPSLLCIQWCIELLRHVTADPNDRFDMLDALESCYRSLWRRQVEVVYILDLPMPFQYFHIMNLMLFLNLLLWAYSLALQDSYFAPLLYMFVQMMFQGIRELATSLSNPYGTDEVDFPVVEWMVDTYSKVYSILSCPCEADLKQTIRNTPLQRPHRAAKVIDLNIDTSDGQVLFE